MADGVLPLMASPADIERLRESIARGAARAARDPAAVDVACFIVACASSDRSAAEAAARRAIAAYASMPFYQRMLTIGGFQTEVERIAQAQARGESASIPDLVSDRMVESLSLTGDADRWRTTLGRFKGAGVTQPVVYASPVGGDAKASLLRAVRTLSAKDLA